MFKRKMVLDAVQQFVATLEQNADKDEVCPMAEVHRLRADIDALQDTVASSFLFTGCPGALLLASQSKGMGLAEFVAKIDSCEHMMAEFKGDFEVHKLHAAAWETAVHHQASRLSELDQNVETMMNAAQKALDVQVGSITSFGQQLEMQKQHATTYDRETQLELTRTLALEEQIETQKSHIALMGSQLNAQLLSESELRTEFEAQQSRTAQWERSLETHASRISEMDANMQLQLTLMQKEFDDQKVHMTCLLQELEAQKMHEKEVKMQQPHATDLDQEIEQQQSRVTMIEKQLDMQQLHITQVQTDVEGCAIDSSSFVSQFAEFHEQMELRHAVTQKELDDRKANAVNMQQQLDVQKNDAMEAQMQMSHSVEFEEEMEKQKSRTDLIRNQLDMQQLRIEEMKTDVETCKSTVGNHVSQLGELDVKTASRFAVAQEEIDGQKANLKSLQQKLDAQTKSLATHQMDAVPKAEAKAEVKLEDRGKFVQRSGYISSNSQILLQARMTIAEAKQQVAKIHRCSGFSFEGHWTEEPVAMYFMGKGPVISRPRENWTTFQLCEGTSASSNIVA